MKTIRKILFYVFILVYIVLCPLIILDSLGIMINPGSHKLMTATGIISVDTIPQGASIYINHKIYPKKSPAIIHDLVPGIYTVKIVLPGHRIWEKNITVEKVQATALENILLLPLEWEKEILVDEPYDQLTADEQSPYCILKKGATVKDLDIFQYKKSSLKPLSTAFEKQNQSTDEISKAIPSDGSFLQQKVISFQMAQKSSFLLIKTESKNSESHFWVDTRPALPRYENITTLFINPPENITWDSDDEDNLFYMNNEILNRVNMNKKATDENILSDQKGYALYKDHLYFVDTKNRFKRFDYQQKVSESLTGFLNQLPPVFPSDEDYTFHLFTENLILFLSESGRLLSNKLPYLIAHKKVVAFSKDILDKKVIFWSKGNIGIVDFTKIITAGVFEMGPKVYRIPVNGRNIRQAFWVNDGTHILYLDQDQVKLVEISEIGELSVIDVVKVHSDIAYSDELGKLFYLDQKTHKFTSLTVLPTHEFISFILPDNIQKKEIR